MAESVQSPTGSFVWFDLPTRDEKSAMRFYKSVLAWEFAPGGSDYWIISVNGNMIGGIRKEEAKFQTAQGFMAYFAVPSIKEGSELVKKNGGTLVGEPINIGEHGNFQIFKDLDGNQMALWSNTP